MRPRGAPDNRQPYLGGCNAPYTYPDLNNVFLAAVKAAPGVLPDGTTFPEGTVLMPSFHRRGYSWSAEGTTPFRW